MAEEFTRSVISALVTHLQAQIAGVGAVYPDWPNKNENIVFPAVSVLAREPRFQRCSPYLHRQGTVDEDTNQAVNEYVIGAYTLPVQVDIWARSKKERATFVDRFIAAVQPVTPVGLVLTLADYYSLKANTTMLGYRWLDDEKTPSTQEWRCVVEMEIDCKAIRTTTDYIITQEPELVFSTPNEIP